MAERIEQLAAETELSGGGKVLIVDDDVELASHFQLVLRNAGLEVVVVHKPEQIRARLLEFQPDIVLMDIHMGDYSGIALARMIRFQPEWLGLPIIYLSSEQDRDQQISAVARDADDFIEKPITDQRLVNVVRGRCHRARQLAKLTTQDSLTGLLKHSRIKQELAKWFAVCQRSSTPTAVAMLDLDHFKQVNDTHGHAVGDVVIKALASLLRHRLRKTDIVGRYGGRNLR
nr:diguanylate cyclase [Marinobacter sp. X15-166B]